MDAIILDDILFDAPLEMFVERMHIQKRQSAIEELQDLLDEAKAIARPKVLFKVLPLEEIGDDFVVLGGQIFHSCDLREKLAPLKRVFLTIATCGTELAAWADSVDGLFTHFCADAICEAAMTKAQDALAEYVAKNHAAAKLQYILPGTLDWPLTDQQKLFTLVGDTAPIGVTLTPHGTMRPIKTVSALYYEAN